MLAKTCLMVIAEKAISAAGIRQRMNHKSGDEYGGAARKVLVNTYNAVHNYADSKKPLVRMEWW